MKKGIFYILLIAFLVFAYASTVSAISSLGRVFGGRIISTKALEIASLEGAGYRCYVPGISINIMPMGSPAGTPTSYFIPSSVTSKTKTIPISGKLIMGRYVGKTSISCVYPSYPPMFTSVILDTINLFGTSR